VLPLSEKLPLPLLRGASSELTVCCVKPSTGPEPRPERPLPEPLEELRVSSERSASLLARPEPPLPEPLEELRVSTERSASLAARPEPPLPEPLEELRFSTTVSELLVDRPEPLPELPIRAKSSVRLLLLPNESSGIERTLPEPLPELRLIFKPWAFCAERPEPLPEPPIRSNILLDWLLEELRLIFKP